MAEWLPFSNHKHIATKGTPQTGGKKNHNVIRGGAKEGHVNDEIFFFAK